MTDEIFQCDKINFPIGFDAMNYSAYERYQHFKVCEFCASKAKELFPDFTFENIRSVKLDRQNTH